MVEVRVGYLSNQLRWQKSRIQLLHHLSRPKRWPTAVEHSSVIIDRAEIQPPPKPGFPSIIRNLEKNSGRKDVMQHQPCFSFSSFMIRTTKSTHLCYALFQASGYKFNQIHTDDIYTGLRPHGVKGFRYFSGRLPTAHHYML